MHREDRTTNAHSGLEVSGTSVSPDASVSRRELMATILGAIGAATLTGCTSTRQDLEETVSVVNESIVGSSPPKWAETVVDLKAITGQGVAQSSTSVVIVLGRNVRGDGGGGVFKWIVGTPPTNDDGGTVFLPNTQPNAPDGPGYWLRIYSEVINVRWFGAKGDGSLGDRAAIQNALDAFAPSCGVAAGQVVRTIFVPAGTYLLEAPLNLYGQQRLIGEGQGSILKATETFAAGRGLVEAAAVAGDRIGYWTLGGLERLAFVSTAPDTWVFKGGSLSILTCRFDDLTQFCPRGLQMIAQNTHIKRLDASSNGTGGALRQMLELSGNFNHVEKLESGGACDSSNTEPLVYVHDFVAMGSTFQTTSTTLRDLLLEGGIPAGKPSLHLLNTLSTTIEHIWLEGTNGEALVLTNSRETCMRGLNGLTANSRIRLNNSSLSIDYVSINGQDIPVTSAFNCDLASTVRIDTLNARRDQMTRNFGNIQIGRLITNSTLVGESAETTAVATVGENLLVNPSFEAGDFGWGINDITCQPYVATKEPSALTPGSMLHVQLSNSCQLYMEQIVPIPATLVGLPLTFSIWVRMEGSGGFAFTGATGCGVAPGGINSGERRTHPGSGWTQLVFTVTPLSAGSLYFLVATAGAIGTTNVYLDAACLSTGTVATPSSSTRWVDVSGLSIGASTSAPSSGIFGRGSLMINAGAALGQPAFWQFDGSTRRAGPNL